MKTIVSIERCQDYDLPQVQDGIARALAPWGGIEIFVKRGDKVLLKPNLLYARKPEQAVTTHPNVVEAIARMVLDCGAQVKIGDSPPLPSAHRVAKACGILDVAQRLGVEIVDFHTPSSSFRGKQTYTQNISSPCTEASLQEADVIINLPKLKSHCQMMLTCAVKNLFGCVTGRRKALWHFRLRRGADDFAEMLLANMEKISPELTIVDAIVAMEGNGGPTGGDPKKIGLILAGEDCVALDRIASEIVQLPLQDDFLLRTAQKLGFPSVELSEIDIKGLSLNEARIETFRLPQLIPIGFSLTHLIRGLIKHIIKKAA